MEKIKAGAERFRKEVFPGQKALFERLGKGQHPRALFVACSDSRVDPSLVTQTEPGELFVLRNAGNLVPPYDAAGGHHGGEAPTIEYAVGVLHVRHIIVCGHSHCGAMAALLDLHSADDLPAVRAWLGHAETTRRVVSATCSNVDDPVLMLAATVEQNVRAQLDNLRTHPTVAAALALGRIELHGWVYEFETGSIRALDPRDGSFHPLEESLRPDIAADA
jgi:carbonic anhydrase